MPEILYTLPQIQDTAEYRKVARAHPLLDEHLRIYQQLLYATSDAEIAELLSTGKGLEIACGRLAELIEPHAE